MLIILTACVALPGAARAQQPRTVAPARVKTLPVKDPMLATVIGVLVPGGGQLYSSRYGKGLGILLGSGAFVAIAVDANHSRCTVANTCNRDAVVVGGIVAAAALWGWGWATAANDARLFNTQRLQRTSLAPFLDWKNGRALAGISFATR